MSRKEQSRVRRGVVVFKAKDLIVAVRGLQDNSGSETAASETSTTSDNARAPSAYRVKLSASFRA